MNTTITFRELNYNCITELELLVQWHNDPAIKYRICRFPTRESCENNITVGSFEQEGLLLCAGTQKILEIIDNEPIGLGTLEMDPQKLMTKEPNTAWISVVIGNKRYLRQGIGTRVVKHLEGLARAAGAKRAEIGIFEHNTGSLQMFSKLGYVEFSRQQKHTWWDGRCWDVIRLIKPLYEI